MKLRNFAGIALTTLLACTTQKEDSLEVALTPTGMYALESSPHKKNENIEIDYPQNIFTIQSTTEAILKANIKRKEISKYISERKFEEALENCIYLEISLDPSKQYNHKILADVYKSEIAIYLMTLPALGHEKTQQYISNARKRLKRIGAKLITE